MPVHFSTESTDPLWINVKWFGSLVAIPAGLLVCYAYPQFTYFALPVIFTAALLIRQRVIQIRDYVDVVLTKGVSGFAGWHYSTMTYSSYKYVDIYNAIAVLLEKYRVTHRVETSHFETLSAILNRQFYSEANRRIRPSARSPWKTGINDEVFLSSEIFWRCGFLDYESAAGQVAFILRLKVNFDTDDAIVEVASADGQVAEAIKKKIENYTKEKSVYRGKIIGVSFDREISDEHGELARKRRLKIEFLDVKEIDDEEIVLDDDMRAVLQRSIFSFFENADILRQHRVPLKRGLLLYGPPGTGKTYTCHYIHGKLKGISTIVVAGQSLLQIKSICTLARTLQPCMIVLEDVDLIFSSREQNLYTSQLGDLMDELDGFSSVDNILFILTTNEIERLEKAIRDRPGRISQCIRFGLPNHELRMKYLQNRVAGVADGTLDIAALSLKIDGASQAFIAEMIRYATQINLEKQQYREGASVRLTNSDFDEAIGQMVRDNNEFSNSIIGLNSKIL